MGCGARSGRTATANEPADTPFPAPGHQTKATGLPIHDYLHQSSGNWFVPATDVYGTPERVVLVMDMPGVCFDYAHVNIVDDELVVTGHVTRGEDQDDYVLYREYDVGHYHRHFGLPPTIDRSRIEAVMDDGVLTVTMPKVEEVKPKRIPIRVSE